MKLADIHYHACHDPFEGDRTLWLRSLPAGAKVTKATLVLTPVAPFNGKRFEETFVFNAAVGADELNAEDWGVNKIPEEPGPFVEVDFHARRTLAAVRGSQGGNIGNVPGTETLGASLQVDIGGSYVGIANDGTFMAPDKTPWVVTLPSEETEATPLPGLTVNRFRLSAVPQDPTNSEDPTLDVTKVTVRSVPTNVSVRLGQMAPFWTRLGELAIGETSPDFADVLNAFLVEAQIKNGFYAIPFVIHSDTIARLDVTLDIDYVIEQRVLPPHLSEVTIPYNFSTVPGVDETLTTVSLPRGAIPVSGRSGAQVRGEFEPTRIASGPIGEEPTTFPILVFPECALAQPLEPDTEIAVTGIDLPLANTQPGLAGLHVAIRSDADGKPSGEILTSADVRVEKPLPDQSAWGSATLPSEFRVLPEVRYWLVLQSQVGQAYWNATSGTADEPALQSSRDGGLSWRMATEPGTPAPLAALFRLRDTPDRFTVPVQLQIGKGAHAVRRRLDEFAPLGRVELSFDFADKLGKYLAGPAATSRCGTEELLTNGNFDQPPHDDATRRLFGFDAGYNEQTSGPASIVGNIDLSRGVDLSIERFIALAVEDDGRPVRIDCAGKVSTHTSLKEIVRQINSAMGGKIAFEGGENGQFLDVRSPATSGGNVELFPWCQLKIPTGWEGTVGLVRRLKVPDGTDRVVTVLADPALLDNLAQIFVGNLRIALACFPAVSPASGTSVTEPAILSQRVPVASDCTYLFQFLFGILIVDPSAPPPRWEVMWLNANDELLHTDSATIEFDTRINREKIPLWLYETYETKIIAPSGATQAEIRFIQHTPGIMWLESVSFTSTLETIENASFSLRRDNKPLSWQHLSGWIHTKIKDVVLDGYGPEDAVLIQKVKVIAGERYELRVHAWPAPSLTTVSQSAGDPEGQPIQQRARLELRWLDDGLLDDPVILPLDGRDFPAHAWAGTTPAGATRAEVRLIQPRSRGNLLFKSVSFKRADLVSVPLIFLGEAPGELTISDMRVTYDLPEPPAPPEQALPVTVAATEVSPVVTAPRPLADAAIGIVAGVGERFLSILNSHVTTIAELAALDPKAEIADIPPERRLELKTAAEMIMALEIEAAPFAGLADESLDALLMLPPAELAGRSGRRPERAAKLQRNLRALRLLLKNDDFRSLRLSDLMPGKL